MENIFANQQFPESFIAMTAALSFETQNYVAELLTSEESSLLSFDFPKQEQKVTQDETYWEVLGMVEF